MTFKIMDMAINSKCSEWVSIGIYSKGQKSIGINCGVQYVYKELEMAWAS